MVPKFLITSESNSQVFMFWTLKFLVFSSLLKKHLREEGRLTLNCAMKLLSQVMISRFLLLLFAEFVHTQGFGGFARRAEYAEFVKPHSFAHLW